MASYKSIPRLAERVFAGSAREFSQDRIALLQRIAHECGDIGLFHVFGRPIVFLNKAEFVYAALNEHAGDFELPSVLPAVRAALGEGPFIVKDRPDDHRRQRKILLPSLQPNAISALAGTMLECSRQVEETWRDGQTITIQREMERVTLRIDGEVFFGANLENEVGELRAIVAVLLDLLEAEMKHPLNLPLWMPTPHNRRLRQSVDRLDRLISDIMRKRREDGENRTDLLSRLLSARDDNGRPLREPVLRDHVTIILLSGYDEMAIAVTWAWWLLAKHPYIYDRVLEEVDAVLDGRSPTAADLERLPYTLQIFKEALRLHGPADILKPRLALRDVELDGYRIRRGMRVIVSPHLLHRKPEYFPDPETFDPERFSLENEKQIPRHAYIPFGIGKHTCLGKHFALLEGHLLLAAISQRVRFDLIAGQDVQPRAIYASRPKNDIHMIVRHREGSRKTSAAQVAGGVTTPYC